MLNTCLHNPNVKDKQTVEQFISMNRGIDKGADLPQELLTVGTSVVKYFCEITENWVLLCMLCCG